MKRGDFLKTLGILPFGVFAGKELLANNTEAAAPIDISNDALYQPVRSLNRPDLVKLLVNKTNGKIGNTRLYVTKQPLFDIEYQAKQILKINDVVYNRPNLLISEFSKISKCEFVAKTHKCHKTISAEDVTDSHILDVVYSEIYRRESASPQSDVFVLYDILLAPIVYNPNTFEEEQSVFFRGAFITF